MASLSMVSFLVAFSYYCYIRNKVSRRSQLQQRLDNDDKSGLSSSSVQVACEIGLQVFTFKQLNSATNGFSKSNAIGQVAFGSVYRGVLNDGRKVAIKLMDHGGKHGEEEFKMEVELMGRLSSLYLLGLVGHSSNSNHRLLVYEFMANGGLQEHMLPSRGFLLPECLKVLPAPSPGGELMR